MKLRKVIFQYFIPAKKIDPQRSWQAAYTQTIAGGRSISQPAINLVEGTNCFSEPQSGYFHQLGTRLNEDTNMPETVAIVEHCTTGHMHFVEMEQMRFVTPPENTALNDIVELSKSQNFSISAFGSNTLDIVNFCNENDIPFVRLTDYQIRVSSSYYVIDIYPKNKRYHNITRDTRGTIDGSISDFLTKELNIQ